MKDSFLNNKENKVKDILTDFKLDIDTNDIWDEIADRVPGEENKNGNKRLLIIPFLLLISILGGYLFMNQTTPISAKVNDAKLTSNKKSKEAIKSLSPSVSSEESKIDNKNLIIDNIKEEKQSIQTIKSNQEKTNINSQSKIFNLDITYNKNQNASLDTKISNLPITMIVETLSNPIGYTSNAVNKPLINSYNANNAPINEMINNKSESTIYNTNNWTKMLISKLENRYIKTIEYQKIDRGILEVELSDKLETVEVLNDLKSKNWKPFFTISSGVNYHTNQYAVSNSEVNSLDFAGNETNKIGFSTSFLFGQSYQRNWSWHAGLSYNELVVNYKNQSETVTTEVINGTKEIHIDELGNSAISQGDVEEVTVIQHDILWYRQHQLLDLNLGVGKRLFSYGSWSSDFSIGMAYTLYSNHKGYFHEEGNIGITKITNSHPYRNMGMIKPYLGLSILYNWNKYAVGINTNYQKELNSSMKNTNYYSNKNSQYGIQLSVSYRPY